MKGVNKPENMKYGYLEITDYKGKTYQYGEGSTFSKIRFIIIKR